MILLDTRRRAIYDHTRAVVEEVGRVRAILGERVADLNWGPHYADFQFTSPKESESRTPNDSKPRRRDPTISHPTDLLPANASDPPQAVVHRSRNGSGTYIDDRHPSRGGTAAIQDSPQTEPLELPETGLINTFEDGVAPFQVSVPHGDSHYYVKIESGFGRSVVEFSSSDEVVTLFVRAGETAEIEVPLGRYVLKYAEGTQWYGVDKLFGDSTAYYRADVVFAFYFDGEYYAGHTVELIPQASGNLDTDRIIADEF